MRIWQKVELTGAAVVRKPRRNRAGIARRAPTCCGADNESAGRRILVLNILFVLLTATFVYYLNFVPLKTPLVAIVLTDYEWPLPPNAWAHEDLESIQRDMGRQTIKVLDGSSSWKSTTRGLKEFDQQLKSIARQRTSSGTAIIYISGHGAVDDHGNPCLVPPSASPINSESWIPISELLAHIKRQDLPDELNKASRTRLQSTVG